MINNDWNGSQRFVNHSEELKQKRLRKQQEIEEATKKSLQSLVAQKKQNDLELLEMNPGRTLLELKIQMSKDVVEQSIIDRRKRSEF
jgi:hypothetical protein